MRPQRPLLGSCPGRGGLGPQKPILQALQPAVPEVVLPTELRKGLSGVELAMSETSTTPVIKQLSVRLGVLQKSKKANVALAGWLSRVEHHPTHQGCRFDLWSGHVQESTNECIHKWNNKLMCLSL